MRSVLALVLLMASLATLPIEAKQAAWELRGYEPLPLELLVHESMARLKAIAGGWRAGKSYTTAEEGAPWLLIPLQGAVYWIVGPDYEQARPEFRYLVEGYDGSGLLRNVSMPKQGRCEFRTTFGARVVTRSSVKERTLAGEAPDGILMVEAAQQTYETFLTLRGRVSEKRAPLILSGTFEQGKTWYSDLWEAWQADNVDGGQSFSLPTWDNTIIYPGGRQDPEILALEATFPPDVFQYRFGAKPSPAPTLVFKEFSHLTHVRSCPFDKKLPVQLWIDPGYRHYSAINVVQITYGGDVLHIDEIWRTDLVTSQMIQIAKKRKWWDKVHFAVMCWGGTQHQAMKSPQEVWEQEAGIPVFAEPVKIADGIERHRTYLINPATGKPRMFYDPKCKGSLWEYGRYKYREIVEGRPVGENPIDRDNDALKATAYGLVHNFGFVRRQPIRDVQIVFRTRRGEYAGQPVRKGWGR